MTQPSPVSSSVAVKVFGERNTGTNAFAKLIRKNSTSVVLPTQIKELGTFSSLVGRALTRITPKTMHELLKDWVYERVSVPDAWKHCATYFSDDELDQFVDHPVFIMVRHPASWLFSLRRKPYHALQDVPSDLATFLQTKWKTVARDGLDRKSYLPPALYNEKLRSYFWFEEELRQRGGTVVFVRFEDFVVDQLSVFDLASQYLQSPNPHPEIVANSTKKGGKNASDYAHYYRNQVWADEIDQAATDIIKSEIDWQLISRFYGPEDWRNAA